MDYFVELDSDDSTNVRLGNNIIFLIGSEDIFHGFLLINFFCVNNIICYLHLTELTLLTKHDVKIKIALLTITFEMYQNYSLFYDKGY